jgi:membrane protease YdiL (CAAX protease family)
VPSDAAPPSANRHRVIAAIAVFYLTALACSYAAAQLPPTNYVAGLRTDHGLLIGLGPLIGTLVGCFILRQKLPSLFGHRVQVGVIALLAPIILTAITGFGPLAASGIAGLVFGGSIVVYCLCEEIGWRGFLTTNLGWLKNWHADLASGVLWFAWHFTFMPELYDPEYVGGFIAAIIAGAFGLAESRRRTGGYALAAGWHTAVKLFPVGPLAFALIGLMAFLTWQSGKRETAAVAAA